MDFSQSLFLQSKRLAIEWKSKNMDDAGALRWCQWASRAIPAFVHEKQLRKPAEDRFILTGANGASERPQQCFWLPELKMHLDFRERAIGTENRGRVFARLAGELVRDELISWCHGILSLLFEHPGSEDAGAFAIWFGSSSRLRIAADKLKLHKNLLGRAAAQTLMHFLGRTEHPLNELHLSHNYITREGAVDILKGVAWNPRYPGTLRDSVGRLKYVPLWLRLDLKNGNGRRIIGHHVAVASDQAICEIRDIATGSCSATRCEYSDGTHCAMVHLTYPRQQRLPLASRPQVQHSAAEGPRRDHLTSVVLAKAWQDRPNEDVLRCVGEVGVADAEILKPPGSKKGWLVNGIVKRLLRLGPPYVRFGDWRAGNGAVVLLLKDKGNKAQQDFPDETKPAADGAVRVSAASYKDQHRGFLLGTIRPTFLVEEEGDESGLYVRSGFLLLAAAVASFEFTNLAGVPWYKQAFEHAEELLEGGVNLRQLTDSLLDEFHSFDDTTFLLETEKQLNSILRALEQVQQQTDERRRQMGTVLREEPDMANFARNTARMVRHFWHWERCPVLGIGTGTAQAEPLKDPGDAEHMRGKGGPGDTDDQSENTEAGSVRQAPSKDPAVVAQWTDAKALSTFADLGSKEAQNRPQLGGEWHGVWCPLLHPTRGRPGFRSSDPLLLDSEECRELEQRLRRVRPEQQILLLERSATSAPLMVFGLLAHTVSIRQLWWKVQRLAHPSGCPTLESIARHLPERPTGSGRRQCWLHLQPTVESPESCPTLDGQGHGGLAAQITGGTTASPRTATGLGDPEEDEEESLSRAQFLCRMKTLSDRIGHGAYSAPSRNICVPPGANKAA
ncbi:PDR6 [Symbiodinium microadriaticum]|nr:PDR6 [Symbiodinium microadriaticum]